MAVPVSYYNNLFLYKNKQTLNSWNVQYTCLDLEVRGNIQLLNIIINTNTNFIIPFIL
jgi:hypothetical protein